MLSCSVSAVVRLFSAVSRISHQLSGMKALRVSLAAALGAAVCLLARMPLGAQTAHFSGAIVSLGSGISFPVEDAVDGSGNVYFTEFGITTVEEIVAAGGYTTVKALGGGFSKPYGVAVDGNGNVYVGDYSSTAVKEIPASCIAGANDASCVLSLGGGFTSPDGVAVDGSGDVFVADQNDNAVKEIPVSCIAGANNASCVLTLGSGFDTPGGLTVDGSGDVFVADSGNNDVKEIPASCIAGANNATCVLTLGSGFDFPNDVAVDAGGNVFVGDTVNSLVKEIPASCIAGANNASCVLTLGGGFDFPSGVALDGRGDVFVADDNNNAVKEIMTTAGKFGSVNVGSTSAIPLSFYFAFDTAGTLGSTSVLTQGATGMDFTDAGTGTCTADTAYSAGDTCTVNVVFSPKYAGTRYGAAELLDGSGNVLATGYAQGTGVAAQIAFGPAVTTAIAPTVNSQPMSVPFGLAVNASDDVYIADFKNNRVLEVPAGGGPATAIDPTVNGTGLSYPTGVTVDGAGNLFIADFNNNRIVEVPSGGGAATAIAPGLSGPLGVTVDGAGDLYIADTYNNRVVEVSAAGATTIINSTVNGESLSFAVGETVDGAGDLFIADQGNNHVIEVPVGGGADTAIDPTVNGEGLLYPTAVAVDGAGDLFIADEGNNRVVEIPANGGSPLAFSPAADGRASSYPDGLAIDGAGNLFIADTVTGSDTSAGLVLDYQSSNPAPLSFANTAVGSTSSDSPQSAIVQNIGNSPLNAVTPGLVVTGPNFVQAAGTGTPQDCTSTFALSPGASCNLSISFTPQSAGPLSSSAVFTDNSLNTSPSAAQIIALSGTATQAAQTISFTQPASPVTYGVSPVTLVASGGASGNPVIFSVVSGPAKVSGTNGATLTITGPGTVVVAANQAGNAEYSAAPELTRTITVNKAAQSISFTQPASPVTYSVKPIALSAKASSKLAVTFSIVSGPAKVSGTNDATLTITGAGTVVVTAKQPGNADYLAAPELTRTIKVNKAAQTITFPAIGSRTIGTKLALSATASSKLTVSFASLTKSACTVSGETASLVALGACTIRASQAGNTAYNAAPSVSQSFTVGHAQTVTFKQPASPVTYGVKPIALSATASSKLAVTFGVVSGPAKVSGTHDATLSIKGAGTVVVAAKQAGNATYGAAQVTRSIVVNKATLTVTANNLTMKQGATVPKLTYTMAGFVNGDKQAKATTGQPALSTSATSKSAPDKYPITVKAGKLAAANYKFAFVKGTLTVTK